MPLFPLILKKHLETSFFNVIDNGEKACHSFGYCAWYKTYYRFVQRENHRFWKPSENLSLRYCISQKCLNWYLSAFWSEWCDFFLHLDLKNAKTVILLPVYDQKRFGIYLKKLENKIAHSQTEPDVSMRQVQENQFTHQIKSTNVVIFGFSKTILTPQDLFYSYLKKFINVL